LLWQMDRQFHSWPRFASSVTIICYFVVKLDTHLIQ
jgi:hypothetical protein